MPDSPFSGSFSGADADDDYGLPVRYDRQTCDIIIDLVDDLQQERGSWRAVAEEIALLFVRCAREGAHLRG